MTDDQHGEGTPRSGGRWDPLPQGDYDDGATAFVKLPEGGIDALLASSDSPLAAPGHGYVPPQITVAPGTSAGTDPAATGTWTMPADGTQWPDPNAVPHDGQGAGDERFAYDPGSTGQWTFEEAAQTEAPAGPGQDVTGEWSIPVAGGDLPDESGEFTTSSLVEQWGGGTPPATLPGGAPAPWATQTGQPWGQEAPAAEEATGAGPGHTQTQPTGAAPGQPAPHAPETAEPGQAEDGPRKPGAQTSEPYASAPADDAVDASQDAQGTGGVPEGAEAAQRAPEGAEEAAEPHADPGAAADDAESGRRAAEEPVDGAEFPADAAEDDAPSLPGEEHPLASYVLSVNGTERPVSDAWIGESLLYVLRERLGLAGAKDGCSQGECGACNVQVDGRLVASCLVPAVTAAGSEVRTVEGLAEDGQPSDVQRALARCGAVQCGFCVPGMAMTVHDLLEGNPAPTELETRQALCGNLCRCSGYRGVVEAVKEVVAEREAHARTDEPEQDGDGVRIPHQAGPGAGGVNPSAFGPPGPRGPHDEAYGPDGGQA
ncbi:(2Fe-2S)-binding protein [Streptomyces luteolifulvus]|uniref:(2Fe-2S)-binding protein n=1 Tax=Streptomyces luteolifulvus TaxID=2615112 RepID=A0A6H9URT0_9ACTN|nr:(2Fe-2S)-binding protein [Streptomyces luteolifulvus]KAB1141846.1 (2Fe-2S)-binding protein [Streptomyces luteolifulvus]